MMKTFVKTLIGGALGMIALYAVGKVAYQAGHDIAEAEHAYEQAQHKASPKKSETTEQGENAGSDEDAVLPVPVKKQSRLGMALSVWKALKNKDASPISDFIQNPENHMLEACIKGREIHLNLKPRTA